MGIVSVRLYRRAVDLVETFDSFLEVAAVEEHQQRNAVATCATSAPTLKDALNGMNLELAAAGALSDPLAAVLHEIPREEILYRDRFGVVEQFLGNRHCPKLA